MSRELNSELALTTEQRLEAISMGYDPDLEFKKLALEATYIHAGFTLVPKELLRGIPLAVIGITYREGIPANNQVGDYVSVEAVCGGPANLARNVRLGLIDENDIRIDPNQLVVFNDGSTGVRRQLTQILHESSMINVGPTPEEEEKLASKFDRPYQFWVDYESATQETTNSLGFSMMPTGEKLRFVFLNGLRVSEYEWTPGQLAKTWYFA